MATLAHVLTSDDFLRFVDRILCGLAERGHDVHILTGCGPRARVLGAMPRITCHHVPMTRSITPWEDALCLVSMCKNIARIRPDVVHAHNPKGGLVGLCAARLCGVQNRLYSVHGLPYVTARGPRRMALLAAERASCRLATKVLCVSPSVAGALSADAICARSAPRVLHHGSAQGVDTGWFDKNRREVAARALRRRFGIGATSPLVLFVGRLHREKGLEHLRAVWREIASHIPDAELLIVGAPDETDPADTGWCRSSERVHPCGPLADPAPAYAAADLLVLPSHREGLPTVALEAFAMQVPVVCFDVLGCRDIVSDGVTGRVVPFPDRAAMAHAVVELLSDPEARRRMGDAGRSRVLTDYRFDELFAALSHEYGI